ncbi:MAG: F0F1 ATP synthase subunit alpha [Minisyncoccus archaeiphilus]|jgi:F-type H+-transporting ATPase subunit alpha|uniref:F0F1 ATP synthase subunit alpha n=1 Tax=Minisyncoccus archaeiphilus TaxID=3238481 RepID=UPI0009D36B24|nr:MAG: ATP synthase subunit alpha [Parcubacteria group bacterium ADurb.Bin216]GMX59276.1 MAG: F0F1 ATP synthase subunit alpha [Candidatus Parcubacteria bacterium]
MDIIEQFKKQLLGVELAPETEEVGEVVEIKDNVAKVSGLKGVGNFELVEFEGADTLGLVLNLEEYEVGVAVLGSDSKIKEGTIVKRTKQVFSLPVGEALLGRVVDPLGRPLDGKGEIKTKDYLPLERKGPSVIERQPVSTPLHTGIKAVDALIPIGRGQRELIIGDRGLGKTAIAIDTIINQKNEKNRPICVYVACGQKKSKTQRLIATLEKAGAMEYTIVVCAFPDDPASFVYLAPFTGATMGEYFRDKGQDALAIYDDLTRQAWAWREISLILRRPPGREAYPGDVFYLHSRLLERAARLSEEKGGGSLTALPIIETQAGDISGYIPTNVISITDGQIFLDAVPFKKEQKPAINIGTSVSRVGSAAQMKATKKVSGRLKLDLAQFQELERFSEFTEELDPQTKMIIEKGKRMRLMLRQKDLLPLPIEKEVVVIFACVNGDIEEIPMDMIPNLEADLLGEVEVSYPEILKEIKEKGDLSDESVQVLKGIISKVKTSYGIKGGKK